MKDLSAEVYVTVIAVFFTGLGGWMGWKFTRRIQHPDQIIAKAVVPAEKFDLSKREYEVLKLINQGLSNQEIADRLFVSLNTVKTHTSNLFSKLEVKRRTQAIQRAKELGLIS
jgi:two-component system, NarL family, response regulator LiaR